MAVTLTASTQGDNDLISVNTAIQNAALSALYTADSIYLSRLISAASTAIEAYCMRRFTAQNFTEVYSGSGLPYAEIQLANYPVLAISRIATSPQPVLIIRNTSAVNQRATVATTTTGLSLTRLAAGVSSTATVAFASYLTLDLLAAAVIAVGSGWTASVASGYGSFPSADLLPLQGAATAVSTSGGACLELYTEDSPAWSVSSGVGWRLDADVGYLVGSWPQGRLNIRVDYRAGYDTIPQDVQEACVQYVQDLYQAGLINSNVKSASIGPFSYTLADGGSISGAGFSTKIKTLVGHYRDFAKQQVRHGPD